MSYEREDHITLQRVIKKIKILEKYAVVKDRYFVLFSHKNLEIKYISANSIKLGLKPENFYQLDLLACMKLLNSPHLCLPDKLIYWEERFKKNDTHIDILSSEIILCGIRIKDERGINQPYLIKIKKLGTNTLSPPYSLFELENISGLYKQSINFYWARMEHKRERSTVRYYFSNDNKKQLRELLSKREVEVLKLVMSHKVNNEMVTALGINAETIKTHRKNMIAKTGAKDMTALVQLAKACNLISTN